MKESRTYKSQSVKNWFKPNRGGRERTEKKDISWDKRQKSEKSESGKAGKEDKSKEKAKKERTGDGG